jgi:hypothetical protein
VLSAQHVQTQNVVYLSHHGECLISSSLLWHARFDHRNYASLYLLRKNSIFGLPTIPRKLKQCDASNLVKHIKQPFHDSTSRACRKLELIHSDLYIPMHISSTMGNKFITSFIDDYTRMCWVYSLKYKSQDFETFKIFHVWIQNESQSCIGSLHTDNGK